MTVALFLSATLTLAQIPRPAIREGMSMAEVRRLLPKEAPKQVSRQIFYRKYLEQWMFDTWVVEFLYERGKEPKVYSVRDRKGQ